MIVGFTGTRNGMTKQQEMIVFAYLAKLKPSTVLHGDCIGSDADFHKICMELGLVIEIYPSNLKTRAYCSGATRVYPPDDPLHRNRVIVDRADVMLATPKGYKEELRSGTWAAIRYAQRQVKKLYIIWPDGTIGLMRVG